MKPLVKVFFAYTLASIAASLANMCDTTPVVLSASDLATGVVIKVALLIWIVAVLARGDVNK